MVTAQSLVATRVESRVVVVGCGVTSTMVVGTGRLTDRVEMTVLTRSVVTGTAIMMVVGSCFTEVTTLLWPILMVWVRSMVVGTVESSVVVISSITVIGAGIAADVDISICDSAVVEQTEALLIGGETLLTAEE